MFLPPRAISPSNDALQVICAYPLSGQYGRMVRYLIYPLLSFSLLFSIAGWVAGGALNTAMTYIAITGIHLAAMSVHREEGVVDLDILTAYHVCMVALILSPPLIMWTKSLRTGSGKSVFAIWTILLAIAVIMFTLSAKHLPKAVPCLDGNGVNVTSPADLVNCNLKCSSFSLPLRQGQYAEAMIAPKYYNKMRTVTVAGTIGVSFFILFALVACVVALPAQFASSQVANASETRQEPWGAQAKVAAKGAGFLFSLPLKLSVLATLAWVFVMEFSVLKHLPQAESNTAVTQWGPLAAFALVVLAGGVSRLAGGPAKVYQASKPLQPEFMSGYSVGMDGSYQGPTDYGSTWGEGNIISPQKGGLFGWLNRG